MLIFSLWIFNLLLFESGYCYKLTHARFHFLSCWEAGGNILALRPVVAYTLYGLFGYSSLLFHVTLCIIERFRSFAQVVLNISFL